MKHSHHHHDKPAQISPQQQPLLSSTLPLLQQQHLLNLNAVMQQMPGANSSSSGKRKASNPQKFTRFDSTSTSNSSMPDGSDISTASPVTAASTNLSRALQFMPSFLMMQQQLNNAVRNNQQQHNNATKDEVCTIIVITYHLSISQLCSYPAHESMRHYRI